MKLYLILTIFISLSLAADDFYKILGVSKTADDQQIKRTFKSKAMSTHPYKSLHNREKNEEKFKKLCRAFEVLSNPKLKSQYDSEGEQALPPADYLDLPFKEFYKKFFIKDNKFRQQAKSNYLYKGGPVVELDLTNIIDLYDRETVWMVKFYSPNCGHCHNMKTEWHKFGDKMKGIVSVGAVNCSEEEELCREYNVQGFPHILLFHDQLGKQNEEYKGQRTYEAFSGFATGRMTSYVRQVNTRTYDDFYDADSEKAKVVLFTNRKTTPPLLKVLSKVMKDEVNFGEIKSSEESLTQRLQVSDFPTILGLTSADSGEKYPGGNNRAELEKWIRNFIAESANRSPEARELTSQKHAEGACGPQDSNFCFLWCLSSISDEQNQLLLDLSKQFKNDPIEFYWVNKDANPDFCQKFESEAFVYRPKRKKYMKYSGDMSLKEISDSLQVVTSGGGEFVKLAEVPSFTGREDL